MFLVLCGFDPNILLSYNKDETNQPSKKYHGRSSLPSYFRPGITIGTGIVPRKISRAVLLSCRPVKAVVGVLPLSSVLSSSDEDGVSRTGMTTPHSQFRQLSLGDLVVRSWTRRPLFRIYYQCLVWIFVGGGGTKRFLINWHYRHRPKPDILCLCYPLQAGKLELDYQDGYI